MTLAAEALSYWRVCQRYRGSYSDLAKTHAAHVEIPTLYQRSTNLRIQTHLYNIMLEEGIEYADQEPTHPCA